ncbi:MAG: hypothetical protein KGN00_07260 [Chloroflexota bacterium]|nr:hypothetical protein [Chloroflexota bacterium]
MGSRLPGYSTASQWEANTLQIACDIFSFPFLILHILVFNIALNAAIAWRCWGGLPPTAPGRVAADGQAPAPA